MTKRKKIAKDSTQPVEVAKLPSHYDEYYNTLAYQMAPANDQFRVRVAIKLTEWAKNLQEPHTIEDFIDTQGINSDTYYEWIKRCPELKEAHAFARRRLSNLRLRKGTTGEWNWSACRWALPFLDPQYLEYEKQLESVKQADSKGSAGTTYIVVDKIPDSELVPKRDS